MGTRFLMVLSLFLLYTCYKATQLWPSHKVLASVLGLLFFGVAVAGTLIYRKDPSVFEETWFQGLFWAGSLAMGFWATFFLLSLPVDVFQVVVSIWEKISGSPETDIGRRAFLFRNVSISIFGLTGAMVGLGFWTVMRGPKVREVSIPIKDLNPDLQGLKIAQISDLHVGPTIRTSYVEEVVRRTNATNPDLIFVTGDNADALPSSIEQHLEPLKNLKARFGVYYVTGNHEYYWDPKGLIKKFRELGFSPLLNENKVIQVGGTKIMVAGVTDPAGAHALEGHAPDTARALQSTEQTALKILLAHRPDACDEAEPLGFDLQFSGHTHAGQFFPFSLLIGFAHKYSRGLYKHGNIQVYVNPGTGYWGPANRLGIGSEITLASLAKA